MAREDPHSRPASPEVGEGHPETEPKTPWPHAPTHRLASAGTYFVSASTYLKQHHFRERLRLGVLHRGPLTVANDFGWALQAWAVFSNHYHFVAHCPPGADSAESLSRMLGELHKKTATWINARDRAPGRKVWHNFWETRLTYEKSYYARLNYTHQNPVRHGLVRVADQYPWCSAAWFQQNASPAHVKTVYSFRIDRVNVEDDFEPEVE